MTRIEYELLREREPQLKLVEWIEFEHSPMMVGWVKAQSREDLIGKAAAKVMTHSVVVKTNLGVRYQ